MHEPDCPQINNLTINGKGKKIFLMNLKTNKALGPDDLPAYILKELSDENAPYTNSNIYTIFTR